MSKNIALQADVGTLGVAGLGAFTQVLSAITADNVAPMALIQLEQLGNLFLCNGPYAKRMPDLLRRSSSYRMERLGLMVGWRKNDAPSYLANTAGGQSIALLIACLPNLQMNSRVGEILHELCAKHLPREFNIASPSQLSEVTNCIFAKTRTLGFTHLLADTVTRIRRVYLNLSKAAPAQLLEDTQNDYLLDFLNGLSHALREDHTVFRVTGSWAMGAIATLSLMICPEDTVLSVEQIILHQGIRQNILIEIASIDVPSRLLSRGPDEFKTTFILERLITGANELRSVQETPNSLAVSNSYAQHHVFSWDSWLLDTAKLRCIESGFDFPDDAATLLANIIARMHYTFYFYSEGSKEGSRFPSPTFADLLGSDAENRISTFCYRTLGVRPFNSNSSIEELSRILLELCMKQEPTSHPCSSLWAIEWRKEQLVRDLSFVALDGFLAVFLEPGKDVAITNRRWFEKKRNRDSEVDKYVQVTSMDEHVEDFCTILHHLDKVNEPHDLNEMIFGLLRPNGIPWMALQRRQNHDWTYPESYENFGQGNYGCVLYPMVLDEFELRTHTGLRYRFEPGYFVSHYRRYRTLRSVDFPPIQASSLPLNDVSILTWPLQPSAIGRHEGVILSCRERFDGIELNADLRTNGYISKPSLPYIVAASSVLETLPSCGHSKDEPLSFDEAFSNHYGTQVYLLGVNTGWKNGDVLMDRSTPRIAFSLTRDNPEAQFYSLAMLNRRIPQKLPEKFYPWRVFFQGECCMKCAIERCQFEYHGAFIILD